MAKTALNPVHVAGRVVAGVFGSYAFSWGFTAASIAALVGLGAGYEDAEMAVLMLAFLVFLGLFLWSFAAASLARVWAVLGMGTVLLFAAAWVIQRAILS
ncbi:MAG: iron uptake protein [Burkholderiaceae bacterium]